MINKNYSDYATFGNTVETLFLQFEGRRKGLKFLLNFSFGIIQAYMIIYSKITN